MKKTILAFVLAAVACGAHAQLMYKVSGNGLEKPSYVVGTYRLAPQAMGQLITGMTEALNATDQVYGEINTDYFTADNSQAAKTAGSMQNGKTIQQLLSASELARFNAFLMKTQGQDLRNRVLAAKVENRTPGALAKDMAQWLYLANNRGIFDPMSQVDSYFIRLAKKNNMPVYGLETVDEYIKATFQSGSEARQKERMMCLIDHQDFYQQKMSNILNGYMSQNMSAIETAVADRLGGSCDATPEETAELNARIAAWAQKMPDIMSKTPTLFTIDVQHMVGEQGLLQLLRNAGYEVEAMK